MSLISSFAALSTRLCRLSHRAPARFYAVKSSSNNDTSLVIFDKDGTLICFHTMWTPWVTGVARGLELGTGMGQAGLGMDVYRLLGVSTRTKRVGPGLLAEATMPDIKSRLAQLLAVYGFEPRLANEIINVVWRENEARLHTDSIAIKPIIDDLPDLFRIIKSKNFKIAVCTADNRRSTERTLEHLELTDLIDGVVCGDDADSRPKPSPYNVAKLCRQLNVPAWRTFVVGDTLADLQMGQQAHAAGSIGVLSGIGSRDHLLPFADEIVDSVADVLPILARGSPIASRALVAGRGERKRELKERKVYRDGDRDRREYLNPLFAYMHSVKELLK